MFATRTMIENQTLLEVSELSPFGAVLCLFLCVFRLISFLILRIVLVQFTSCALTMGFYFTRCVSYLLSFLSRVLIANHVISAKKLTEIVQKHEKRNDEK